MCNVLNPIIIGDEYVWIYCQQLSSVPNCELLEASLVFALWAFAIRVRHGMDLSRGSKWISIWLGLLRRSGAVNLSPFFWIIILESYLASRPMSYLYLNIKNLKLAQGWIGTVPKFPWAWPHSEFRKLGHHGQRGLHHCLHQPMEGTHLSCYVSCWAWRASIAFVDSCEGIYIYIFCSLDTKKALKKHIVKCQTVWRNSQW